MKSMASFSGLRRFSNASTKGANGFNGLIVFLLLTFMISFSSQAQYQSVSRYSYRPGDMSVGAAFGTQLGVVGTYALTSRYTLEAGAAMELNNYQNIHSWGSFLWSYPRSLSLWGWRFGWFGGGGVKFRTEYDPEAKEEYLVGPRVVGGLTQKISSWLMEAFLQGAYTQYVTQASKGEADFALGVRYFF